MVSISALAILEHTLNLSLFFLSHQSLATPKDGDVTGRQLPWMNLPCDGKGSCGGVERFKSWSRITFSYPPKPSPLPSPLLLRHYSHPLCRAISGGEQHNSACRYCSELSVSFTQSLMQGARVGNPKQPSGVRRPNEVHEQLSLVCT